jgi:hypothetical protein
MVVQSTGRRCWLVVSPLVHCTAIGVLVTPFGRPAPRRCARGRWRWRPRAVAPHGRLDRYRQPGVRIDGGQPQAQVLRGLIHPDLVEGDGRNRPALQMHLGRARGLVDEAGVERLGSGLTYLGTSSGSSVTPGIVAFRRERSSGLPDVARPCSASSSAWRTAGVECPHDATPLSRDNGKRRAVTHCPSRSSQGSGCSVTYGTRTLAACLALLWSKSERRCRRKATAVNPLSARSRPGRRACSAPPLPKGEAHSCRAGPPGERRQERALPLSEQTLTTNYVGNIYFPILQ